MTQTEQLKFLVLPPDRDQLIEMSNFEVRGSEKVHLHAKLLRDMEELLTEAKSELNSLGLMQLENSPICKLRFKNKGVCFSLCVREALYIFSILDCRSLPSGDENLLPKVVSLQGNGLAQTSENANAKNEYESFQEHHQVRLI